MNNMYKFVEALDSQSYKYLLEKFGHSESSDLAQNPEGWILTEQDIYKLPSLNIKVYDIPNKYQNDIIEFKMLFWDGDFIFE